MSKFLNIDGLSHLINIVKTKFQTITNKVVSNHTVMETTVGAKYYNLLKNEGVVSSTTHGITFIKNDDGSITANGTATANADYYFIGSFSNQNILMDLSDKSYILSFWYLDKDGNILSISENDLYCRVYDRSESTSVSAYVKVGANKSTIFSGRITTIFVTVQKSIFIDGKLFVMIRPSEIEDDTYIPYHEDLSTQITNIQSNIDNINKLSYLDDPILLESGQDLDELVNPGFYHSPNGTISQSLLNAPSDIGYSGSVLVRVLQTNIYQIWISANFAHNSDSTNKTGLYIRNHPGNVSTWSEWFSLL